MTMITITSTLLRLMFLWMISSPKSSNRKMKKLTRDHPLIVIALKEFAQLVVIAMIATAALETVAHEDAKKCKVKSKNVYKITSASFTIAIVGLLVMYVIEHDGYNEPL